MYLYSTLFDRLVFFVLSLYMAVMNECNKFPERKNTVNLLCILLGVPDTRKYNFSFINIFIWNKLQK